VSVKYLSLSGPPDKSGHATLEGWRSTARVSKLPSRQSAACLHARYCANLAWFDLLTERQNYDKSQRE